MVKPVSTLKNLWIAIRTHNMFDECSIYLDAMFGLHPHNRTFLNYVKHSVLTALVTFQFFLCLLLPINFWKGIESLGESELLSPTYQTVFALIAYRKKQKGLSKIIDLLDGFHKHDEHEEELQSRLKSITFRIQRLYLIYQTVLASTILVYVVMPFISSKRQMSVAWYDFCDLEGDFCYGISLFIQVVNNINITWYIVTCDGLFLSIVVQVSCQIRTIKYSFEQLKINEGVPGDDEETLRELSSYIEHHAYIMNFMEELQKFYSPIVLSQLISCTYTLCIGSFLLTIDGIPPPLPRFMKFLMYLFCILGQISVYCVAGQFLLEECSSVANVVYDTKWWSKTQPKLRRSLLLVILTAQKECSLTVGGITKLNLQVYSYIARTAFSFYTLMNQLYTKTETRSNNEELTL